MTYFTSQLYFIRKININSKDEIAEHKPKLIDKFSTSTNTKEIVKALWT